ncbi:MAG TPA: hypothetical protein VMS22_24655 [Candidatus Eisenbacteria bacterium]|nr:hypothetical protein [Candidatus Eisenbacteria bacterium]
MLDRHAEHGADHVHRLRGSELLEEIDLHAALEPARRSRVSSRTIGSIAATRGGVKALATRDRTPGYGRELSQLGMGEFVNKKLIRVAAS